MKVFEAKERQEDTFVCISSTSLRLQIHPQQQVFDVPEAQSEAMAEPDGMTDDFWREAVTTIA